MATYKIAYGTILAPMPGKRVCRPFKAGEIISSEMLGATALREMLMTKQLIAEDKAVDQSIEADIEQTLKSAHGMKVNSASGEKTMTPDKLPTIEGGKKLEGEMEDLKKQVNTGVVQVSMSTPPSAEDKAPEPAAVGRWNFEPTGLLVKTLEQLNASILEIDPKIEPFKDKQEAIAWLSQDYKG
jgi:hypothetical protein